MQQLHLGGERQLHSYRANFTPRNGARESGGCNNHSTARLVGRCGDGHRTNPTPNKVGGIPHERADYSPAWERPLLELDNGRKRTNSSAAGPRRVPDIPLCRTADNRAGGNLPWEFRFHHTAQCPAPRLTQTRQSINPKLASAPRHVSEPKRFAMHYRQHVQVVLPGKLDLTIQKMEEEKQWIRWINPTERMVESAISGLHAANSQRVELTLTRTLITEYSPKFEDFNGAVSRDVSREIDAFRMPCAKVWQFQLGQEDE